MTQGQSEAVIREIGAGEGLSWSWHLDLDTLLAALSEPAPWNRSRLSAFRPVRPADGPAADQAGDRLVERSSGELSAGGSLPGAPSCAQSSCPAPRVDPADPVEADFAEYLDAVDAGRSSVVPLSVAAGRVAEVLADQP